ncbi:MAG: thioredoxin domain-containing protein [Pirellulaceae bacterium]
MPNRLANETSPYLLQHAHNPVDWYPWGPEALGRAKKEHRPIFLSIGYSACHWCHVMAHESFEDPKIAAKLNETFVNIKVDREERPDLDQIYMNAVQVMTGRGGWPMSVFLTPDLEPFFGGTYWPPEPRMGMPGFAQVIAAVDEAWRQRQPQTIAQARQLTRHLQRLGDVPPSERSVDLDLLTAAAAGLQQIFDFTHGGFGRAPKFPRPIDLQLLLRVWYRQPRLEVLNMVKLNLDKMARGGIYDHLAGGFARYSVDERWLVPHFEKMLYDNALLTGAYLDGYRATGNEDYRRVARETLDYVLEYMTDPEGGFHSTEDADSEGEEGKFYVWTPAEVEQVLGKEKAERFCDAYDVTSVGNFEGRNILNLRHSIAQCASLRGWDLAELTAELAESRAALLKVRDRRVRPAKDDKVLVSWNGLMIEAMGRAAGVLDEPEYLDAATRAAAFIWEKMRTADGRLLHSWRRGKAKFAAYLDDYAGFANALVTLYEAGFDERWIDNAVQLADIMLARFADSQRGGFFFTADDHEQLISRQKDWLDSSVPSGNGMAATVLIRLGKLCGRSDYLEAAERTLKLAAAVMEKSPIAAGQALIAADMWLGPMPEIVVVGSRNRPETANILAKFRTRYVPSFVIAFRDSEAPTGESSHLNDLFDGKTPVNGRISVFECEGFRCQAPLVGEQAILSRWEELGRMAR